MKVLLMHLDRNFEAKRDQPWNAQDLIQDLGLDVLLKFMAGEDVFVRGVVQSALLSGASNDMATILHRQDVLKDGLRNSAVVRNLYALTVETVEAERKHWWLGVSKSPSSVLYESDAMLHTLVGMLKRLRSIADEQAGGFSSRGFTALFEMIRKELSDEYLKVVEENLLALRFHRGILLSAELGRYNGGTNYVLHRQPLGKLGWLDRIRGKGPVGYTFFLGERDDLGAQILSDIQDSGINRVANALAQSSDHIVGFFDALRTELAFYVGCLNLHERLIEKGLPTCFPAPVPQGSPNHSFDELYDVSLALSTDRKVVGNTTDCTGKDVVMITGANQGGKSSFLRSIGLAQMMMQCGLFVGAQAFEGALCAGLFTHHKREEEATMFRGKLDEELARLSRIADHLIPDSVILFNESFSATNEREGSEIAEQVVRALTEKGMRIFFVTHLYELAHGLFEKRRSDTLFLRAERRPDGTRTFKLIEGEPLESSFGADLYREIFESGASGGNLR